jgi:pyruvate dehydrogenase E2 component (dihydrolipoamide acetyltransferase)
VLPVRLGSEQKTTPEEKSHQPIRAIPSVRARAKALGLDLDTLSGSGPEGRILRDDVERAASQQNDVSSGDTLIGAPVERIPFRGVRRSGVRRVSESSEKVAAVTFVDDADITKLEQVRINKKDLAEEKGFSLTYLPFVIKSLVSGLKTYPFLNATLDEAKEGIILKKYCNIGIAVDAPAGLMVFVIQKGKGTIQTPCPF